MYVCVHSHIHIENEHDVCSGEVRRRALVQSVEVFVGECVP